MEHDKTQELLKQWQVNATLPANFDSVVWRRIEKARPVYDNVPALVFAWINQLFARPAVALSYVSVALLAGMAFGQVQASRDAQKAQEQLKSRYIQSIDPYAKPLRQ
jgi:hypothetical protein